MADFESKAATLRSLDIRTVAASVDPVGVTSELSSGLQLQYVELLAGLDGPSVAEVTGAAINNGDRTFLHATGFVLDPGGSILTACYSTGAVGRLHPIDVAGAVATARR